MCAARYGAGVGSTTTVAEDDEPLRGRTNWGEDDALLFCEKGVCVEDGAGAGTAKGGLGCSTKGVKRRPEDSALTSSACDLERPPPSSAFPRRRLSFSFSVCATPSQCWWWWWWWLDDDDGANGWWGGRV